MGDINSASANYAKLFDKEYYLVIGKGKKQVHITIEFSKAEFCHICGLHKLDDIVQLTDPNKKRLFGNILNKKITSSLCQNSTHYSEIDERIDMIENLEKFLDSNQIIFKFNKSANPFSSIESEYILKNSDGIKNSYVFLSNESRKPNTYFCRSVFSRKITEPDYTKGHTPYKLLYKEKIDLKTKTRQVLYVHPAYNDQQSLQSQQNRGGNGNINQIKFEIPLQSSGINSAGVAAAIIPAPNPFRNLFERIKSGFKSFFIAKNGSSEAKASEIERVLDRKDTPELSRSVVEKPSAETILPEKSEKEAPCLKEFKEMSEAREAFIAGRIPQSEYVNSVRKYITALETSENRIIAADYLRSQLANTPENTKKYISFELNNIERNIKKDAPKSSLSELKRAAHEQYMKQQSERENNPHKEQSINNQYQK